MKYCDYCVMPDTRPGLKFFKDENGKIYAVLVLIIKIKKILIIKQDLKSLKPYAINTAE